jgi:hypothetical protein
MNKNLLTNLRSAILDILDKLINDEITIQKAAVAVKAADVIINSYRLELEQSRLNGASPNIKFIEGRAE